MARQVAIMEQRTREQQEIRLKAEAEKAARIQAERIAA